MKLQTPARPQQSVGSEPVPKRDDFLVGPLHGFLRERPPHVENLNNYIPNARTSREIVSADTRLVSSFLSRRYPIRLLKYLAPRCTHSESRKSLTPNRDKVAIAGKTHSLSGDYDNEESRYAYPLELRHAEPPDGRFAAPVQRRMVENDFRGKLRLLQNRYRA